MQNSPLSKIILEEREFFVKRDDLIDPCLAGNKYRKLYTLLNTPDHIYDTLISYGGTQSNAMLALAALCQKKKWKFLYYTKKLSATQKEEHSGNYAHALKLGMQHREIENDFYKEFIASLRFHVNAKTCFVDQGGAVQEAKAGLKVLAQEIQEQSRGLHVKAVATPSGTGTTALFLALALPEYRVYTTPCIGDSSYLKTQMRALAEIPDNLVILEPKRKYHFAKPYKEFYEIYSALHVKGIEFDLLYAPAMWQALLEQTSEKIIYIHSGGVSGNESMLERYRKKGFVSNCAKNS
ncbi:1-aminocyclopropane-1-carboxylate deaminase [Sulfurimonas sp. SWIR-19]|uniref:1-aminocyclopropane-1-carboxylate deaminase n=1 Tax=Sulfurimonas sp. SWIR-19 TaxID=2878390 RepID=UPI001CF21DA0|nr:1-aminocyclopropane-1-carboxylate deaminase [Sulfurimonas sp. SWIR-19]UCM99769.1 1-aminocyclopropane-1-carboxylate deaminase [Sulfurimonas sp. SWIR-19]